MASLVLRRSEADQKQYDTEGLAIFPKVKAVGPAKIKCLYFSYGHSGRLSDFNRNVRPLRFRAMLHLHFDPLNLKFVLSDDWEKREAEFDSFEEAHSQAEMWAETESILGLHAPSGVLLCEMRIFPVDLESLRVRAHLRNVAALGIRGREELHSAWLADTGV